MKYLHPFRIASYLLVLFCVGHTTGGMLAQKSQGNEADAVFSSMKRVHFVFNGASCSWYDFWLGFGLMVSAFLLLAAAMSWRLADVEPRNWSIASPFAWLLAVSMVANTALSIRYFFAGPAILSTLVVVLMVSGIISKQRARVADQSPGILTG